MNDRNGWGVAITRKDGSSFLACAGPGLMPAVWYLNQRKRAVAHKRELRKYGLKAVVVRVLWSDVQVAPKEPT